MCIVIVGCLLRQRLQIVRKPLVCHLHSDPRGQKISIKNIFVGGGREVRRDGSETKATRADFNVGDNSWILKEMISEVGGGQDAVNLTNSWLDSFFQ